MGEIYDDTVEIEKVAKCNEFQLKSQITISVANHP